MKSLTMTLCCIFFAAASVAAQGTAAISTIGEGEVSMTPDIARVSVGVVSRAAQAEAALAATSDATAEVLDKLRATGVAAEDIQTSAVSLFPVRPPRSDTPSSPEIEGFEARNTLRITVRDLSSLGGLLDRVVEDGANALNGLSFDVQNQEAALAQARAAAVRDAMARAQQLADAAGVSLGDILSVSEQSGLAAPMMDMASARLSEVPVAPGALTISARVEMRFEIEQ